MRWAARHDAYTHFFQSYHYIIKAFENISYSANAENCGKDFQAVVWDPKSKGDTASLIASLTSFDFIVTFMILYDFLSHLAGVTVKLQGVSMDIVSYVTDVALWRA